MKRGSTSYVALAFLLAGLVIIVLPFAWMVASAFKSSAEILRTPPTFFPQRVDWEGFRTVLFEVPFARWFANSLFVAVVSTAGMLFTSSVTGYIFAKFRFKGKRVYFAIILATLMVPVQVVIVPTYLIVSNMGLVDTYGALIIPSLVTAFGIFLCKQFIEGIPRDLIEAARIDGAGEFSIYARIILPESRAILAALAIFMFMFKWNDYLWPLIAINSPEKMPLPLALTYFSARHYTQVNVIYAGAALIMAPIVVVYFIFQRHFIQGLSLTGLK